MRLPDTSLFTIIQLVMGSAMGIAGAALLFGLFAMSANVEDDIPVSDNIQEMVH